MTLFEILNFNRELLERLAGTGYKPDDYKYIDLYKEYEQMRRKGEKGDVLCGLPLGQTWRFRKKGV